MYRILHFLTGYIRIKIGGKEALNHINTLHGEDYRFWNMSVEEDGYSISCSVAVADKLLARLSALEAEHRVIDKKGLPFSVYRYRLRWGLLAGMLIAMAIVFLSTTVIWEIRLECNGDFDREAVLSELKDLGVYDGAPIKKINVYQTELGFLVRNPHFSDIAVNLQGTVAAVKLRVRTESPRQEPKENAPYDVVASEAGIITYVSAVRGVPVVIKGETVDKGDVLISGIMQGAYGEYYLHHAYGNVKARVYREFSVTVPLSTEEKEYTGNTCRKTAFCVLGKNINLFKSEFSSFERADIEVSKNKLSFLGAKLPAEKQSLIYKEYILTQRILSQQEGEERAKNALSAYIKSLDGEVQNTLAESFYDKELNAVVLNATVELVTEIGVEAPMSSFPD